jgi:hypothetical protein
VTLSLRMGRPAARRDGNALYARARLAMIRLAVR